MCLVKVVLLFLMVLKLISNVEENIDLSQFFLTLKCR